MMTKEIQEAVDLLRDPNLVWGNDIEDIKDDLANLLLVCASQNTMMEFLAHNLAKKLVYSGKADSFDLKLEKR
jgi:hypothetical protein